MSSVSAASIRSIRSCSHLAVRDFTRIGSSIGSNLKPRIRLASMEMLVFLEPRLRMASEKTAITVIENASAIVILTSRSVERSEVDTAAGR
jgi:hypothetical protein